MSREVLTNVHRGSVQLVGRMDVGPGLHEENHNVFVAPQTGWKTTEEGTRERRERKQGDIKNGETSRPPHAIKNEMAR